MRDDFTVTIKYKNDKLEEVGVRTFTFEEYCQFLALELKHIILDVEDVFYNAEEGKEKSEWDGYNTFLFNKIRHKLLDQANAVERIPSNLRYQGNLMFPVNMSEVIANLINSNKLELKVGKPNGEAVQSVSFNDAVLRAANTKG